MAEMCSEWQLILYSFLHQNHELFIAGNIIFPQELLKESEH
jgi:hypothetical protein